MTRAYSRTDLFAEKTPEERSRGLKIMIALIASSIAFSLALAGLFIYVRQITSDVTIQIDHSIAPYKSRTATVGDALAETGFKVDPLDIVEPSIDSPLADGMAIRVQRVRIKTEVDEEATDFKTIEEEDTSMNKGEYKTTREGKQGKDQVTYEVTYTAGKETDRREVDRKTIKKPVNKVVHVGVIETIDGFAYTRKETFQATAYTGGGTTASGTRARVGEIAVDPSVIPLGTTVYVEGFGLRTAEDTGGAVKGHIIDIYMGSRAECIQWGRRDVTVYLP